MKKPDGSRKRGQTSLILFLHISLFIVPYILIFRPVDIYGYQPVIRYFYFSIPIFLAGIILEVLIRRRMNNRGSSDPAWGSREIQYLKGRIRFLSRRKKKTLYAGLTVLVFVLLSNDTICHICFSSLSHPIMHMGIMYSLNPSLFLFAVVLLFLALLAIRFLRPAGMFRRKSLIALYWFWLVTVLSVAYLSYFKMGPSLRTCSEVGNIEEIAVLFQVEPTELREGVANSMPYDTVFDEEEELLFVSNKRTDGKPGGISRIDLRGGSPVETLVIDGGGPGVNVFPERMVINRSRKEVYALVLGLDCFALQIASYQDGLWCKSGSIPLKGEPNHIFFDQEKGGLVILFAGADEDGLVVYDTETWEVRKRWSSDHVVGSCQFPAMDRFHDRFYFTNIGFSSLYMMSADLTELIRKGPPGLPLIGVDVAADRNLIYAASPITHDCRVIDPDTLSVVDRIETGGLADIKVDEGRGVLFIGDYGGDFSVVSLDTGAIVKKYFLGRMLRSIHLNRETGRVFACSGCGVFEILLDGI